MLGGSFDLLRQRLGTSDIAWQLSYQAESKWARRAYNPLAVCKILACFSAMRPARHHSTVHQEESYAAAELGSHAKPDSFANKRPLAFIPVSAVHR